MEEEKFLPRNARINISVEANALASTVARILGVKKYELVEILIAHMGFQNYNALTTDLDKERGALRLAASRSRPRFAVKILDAT